MPGIITLDPEDDSLDTLRVHWFYTCARVEADPNATQFAPTYTAFGPQWDAVDQQERKLREDVVRTEVAAFLADRTLNTLNDAVSAAIHDGKKPDVSLPLHQLYFGNLTPSEARRPILGSQLERMRAWPPLLTQAQKPALQALSGQVQAAVDAADKAAAARQAAETAYDQFRLTGEKQQLFDAYNALAATTYGGLRAVAHGNPALGLPPSWAESFFRRQRRSDEPTTSAQAQVELTKAQAALAAAQKLHDELVASEQQHALDEAAADEAQKEADAAEATAKQAASTAKQKKQAAKTAKKKARKSK